MGCLCNNSRPDDPNAETGRDNAEAQALWSEVNRGLNTIIRQTNQTKVGPNSKFQAHKAVQIQEKVTKHEHESKRDNLRETEKENTGSKTNNKQRKAFKIRQETQQKIENLTI